MIASSKHFIGLAMRGIACLVAMSLVFTLAGCGSVDKKTRIWQALAAKSYNDVSACYGITELKTSEGNDFGTAPSSFDASGSVGAAGNEGMTVVPARFHSSHSSHSHTHHFSDSHHSGGVDDSHAVYKDSSVALNDEESNRAKGKLADGTDHDRLITDGRTRDWYSHNQYYVPSLRPKGNAGSDVDKNDVAYGLAGYIEDRGSDVSENVAWKRGGKDYTGVMAMHVNGDGDKFAKLTASIADNDALDASCSAVRLPTMDEVSDAIGVRNDGNRR